MNNNRLTYPPSPPRPVVETLHRVTVADPYRWLEGLDAEPKLLLDPNQFSEDGTVALSGYAISEDGRLLAYGLSASGSDWQTWRVREVDSGQDRPDRWAFFVRTLSMD